MKSISAGLATHLAGEVTTLATCWRVTQIHGGSPTLQLGFTDHDKDLVISGVTYKSIVGFNASDVATNSSLAVDNLDVLGVLSSPSITEDDLRAGLWDYAEIRIFLVNWANLSHGSYKMRFGHLGEVTVKRDSFSAELRGLMQELSTSIGQITSPACRTQLGDIECGVNLTGSPGYTVTGAITAVGNEITLFDSSRFEAAGYFTHGKITFTSGLNRYLSMEVKDFSSGSPIGTIILHLPMPYAVGIGDTYSMHAGCDKIITTCIAKFNNVVNFRGEPYLPGIDKIVQVGRR